jgi:hypothetical protein
MPKETDEGRLKALRAIFASRASNEPFFRDKALYGGERPDEGLDVLIPGDLSPKRKIERLKAAIVRFLDQGGAPNRREEPGDRDMGLDVVIFYEFRLEVDGVMLYVKTSFDEHDPTDPDLDVRSVKRADRG